MEPLDAILKKRHAGPRWYRIGSVVIALAIHVLLGAAALVAPEIFAEKSEPLEFVAVTVVPAAALGQIAPPPPEPEPRPAPPPEPEPERTPPPPEPEPEPPPRQVTNPAPTIPSEPSPRRREPNPAPQIEPRPQQPEPIQPRPRQGSPQGNPLATGGPAQITGFDDPDFTYSYYADLLLARIRAVWQRPPIEGDVAMTIYFRIHEDGRISDVRIVESSGYNAFDRAGLRAVQTANMPPLPKSYRKDSLGVRLIIH